MQYCPPFPTNFDVYFQLLNVIFFATLFINSFAIFCIFTRSSKQMAGYRWQLLIHTVFGALVDIFVSILTKPIMLLPLPLGYPTGLISKFTSFSPHYQLVISIEIIVLSLGTALQLFFYRYVVATGRSQFSKRHILLLAVGYVFVSWPACSFLVIYENQQKLLSTLYQSYSCITAEILAIPSIQTYSPQAVIHSFSIPVLCICVFYIVAIIGLVIGTYKNLQKSSISRRTVFIQKKFLRQLILQVSIPILNIIIPAGAILIVISFQIFGMAMLSLFMLAAISTYGASGAVVLIYLNPSYRHTLLFWRNYASGSNQVSPISIVWIGQTSKTRIKL